MCFIVHAFDTLLVEQPPIRSSIIGDQLQHLEHLCQTLSHLGFESFPCCDYGRYTFALV
jgi:hypothetical protein